MDPDSRRLRVTVTDGRGRPVPDQGLARWLAAISPARFVGEVGIGLVSDRRIRTLNHRYRGKDAVTDVLSFAADGTPSYLGDIVIARGTARRQALQAGHSASTELRVLALHGLLHLLGYDHDDPADEGRMARIESRLRRKGGLREGLIGRANGLGRSDKKRQQRAQTPGTGNKKRLRPATARRAGVGPRSHKK